LRKQVGDRCVDAAQSLGSLSAAVRVWTAMCIQRSVTKKTSCCNCGEAL